MDFFIGSATTLFIFYFVIKYFSHINDKVINKKSRYAFNQSSLHEMIKNLLPADIFVLPAKKTQAMIYEEKTNVRVIILDGMAYWIRDNKFYEADLDESGINKESTRIVDIMGLDKVQLDKMLFVMDKLREGLENDSGSTGVN